MRCGLRYVVDVRLEPVLDPRRELAALALLVGAVGLAIELDVTLREELRLSSCRMIAPLTRVLSFGSRSATRSLSSLESCDTRNGRSLALPFPDFAKSSTFL